MSDSYLVHEDLTKKVICETEIAKQREEVITKPIFLSGRCEHAPPQPMTASSSAWYTLPNESMKDLLFVMFVVAVLAMIPG